MTSKTNPVVEIIDILSAGQARSNVNEQCVAHGAAEPSGVTVENRSPQLGERQGKRRVLSGSEVRAILERHGFREVRRRGSYMVMQRVANDRDYDRACS